MQPLVLLVAPGYIQRSGITGALFLLEKERSISSAEQAICAGNHIELILCLLLARMMHQQQADVVFICKLFQLADDFGGICLFLNLLAGAPPAQQYANDEQRHLHHLGQLRALLLGSATTVLGACLLYAGLQLYDRQAVAERSAELRAETQLARQRYDAIARTFPPMPTDSASLHRLIERHAELERASATPAGLYRDIARALHAEPTIEIDGIEWHLGAPRPNDARPAQAATQAAPASSSTTENATLRGNLRLGTSKTPRRQLEAFEHFVDALRANPALEVEVQRRPFDIEPGKSLKGSDIDSDDDKPRSFVLHLRRKPAT